MFNLNAMLKFINVNNDEVIQKSEISQFVDKLESPSIFGSYFNSITNDTDISTIEKGIMEVIQQINSENKEIPDFKFKDKNDAKKYNELAASASGSDKGFFPYNDFTPDIKIIKSIEDIPKGSHDNIKDARNCDITQLNLSEEELLNLCIDKTTVMTPEQKAVLEPYMEAAKNPGLGIRQLQEQGITGKGVNMAIIDQPLGMHKEYADNIIGQVHDINSKEMGWSASMHGAAVASIAVGKTVGIAPDAGLNYYSAVNFSKDPKDIQLYKEKVKQEIETNSNNPEYLEYLQEQLNNIDRMGCPSNKPYVDAINKILDKNEKLPKNEQIPVISISWGFNELAPGYEELQQALQRAKEQGVFVVSTRLYKHYGMDTCGANRNPKGNLDDSNNYEAGAFWKQGSEEGAKEDKDKLLLVPMDHRTVADFKDGTSYRYEGNDGGMSWSTPWLAGMYVLAKQADSKITPEKFWQYALETSNECNNNDSGAYVGRIINPQGLIQKIQENKTVE